MLSSAKFVFCTELRLLYRRSQEWLYPLGFFVIVVSLFPLAFSPSPAFLEAYTGGCIWIAALFASVLSIQTFFASDLEDGYLEQLLISQPSLSVIVLAKVAAYWLATQAPLIVLTPVIGYLFGLTTSMTVALTLSLLLGTPIITLIGIFTVALGLGLRQQGVLLGILLLPLTTPVLIFGVSMAEQARGGLSISGPLAFLAGLSLVAIILLPIAISATIRVGLDD